MRKLVVTENITLDGIVDLAGGWFDPLGAEVDQSDINEVIAEQRAAADALLLGRNTFEAFREFWPKQSEDPTGVSDYLNRVSKYVIANAMDDPGWDNTTVLRGPLLDEVQALKDRPGGDVVVTGSIQLVQSLIAADIVDEYRLFVYPVVIGHGARLFESADIRLALQETRQFKSGVVLLRYASA
ncbi:dihydrofolate reductase family protein [Lentzea kentuckyensis]|uniref:dihydrofolate reductase family protein n=1 Tax=Lentzea kentuckyensis TaxID=360086 RepID=UPI000A393EF9|nr:dihydrofolate reductase family protein [Lentzea kentuckyensis]